MAARKSNAPFHKVLRAHIRNARLSASHEDAPGAFNFVSSLITGSPGLGIKPVTLPAWHEPIAKEYESWAEKLGLLGSVQANDVLVELKRQKKAAKAKRANEKKPASTIAVRGGD